MTDILAKNNRLVMLNSDFVLTDGIEEIKQHIIAALNTFYSDWLLDNKKGVNFVYDLKNKDFLEYDIKSQISEVEGVVKIVNFTMDFERESLSWRILAGIKTIYGKIDINEVILQ